MTRFLLDTHAIIHWQIGTPRHHRDPFDRLFIVQARSLHAVLVTRDAAFAAYDVATRWM